MPESFSHRDMAQIMALISEYTHKLRQVIADYRAALFKRLRYLTLMLSVCGVFFAVIVVLMTRAEGYSEFLRGLGNFSYIVFFAGVVSGIGPALYTVTFIPGPKSERFEAHNLAIIVTKLLSIASQYNEHASERIADRFELTLRLAEAEASLKMYEVIFKDKLR